MTQSAMVNVNAMTLNALKKMLFNDKNSMDLTSVVEDLSNGFNTNTDLIAINVGLTYRGIKPDVDTNTRFDNCNSYWREYTEFKFESYSLILDAVKTHQIRHVRKKNVDEWEVKDEGFACFSLENWLNMPTSENDFLAEIAEKNPIKEEEAE